VGTIIVGFVDSPEGRAALSAGREEAFRRGSSLLIVNSSPGGKENPAKLAAVEDALAEAAERIRSEGIQVELLEIALGNDPAGDLLDAASARDAELVVIGLRRRSPVGKLVLGSNSQDILLSAECPVLAVKAPRQER